MRRIYITLLLFGTSTAAFGQTVQNATQFPGDDIGEKIKNAAASFDPAHGGSGGGIVFIPASPTCYSMKTHVTVSLNSIKIQGAGRRGTCILWNPNGTERTDPHPPDRTAFTIKGDDNSMEDLTILGPSKPAERGSRIIGLNVSAPHFSLSRVNLGGYNPQQARAGLNIGLTFGDNAFTDTFIDLFAWFNEQNMVFPSDIHNAGENIRFIGGTFADGAAPDTANCVQIGKQGKLSGAYISFFGTSFDGCQIVSNEAVLKIYGGHFEDVETLNNIPFVVTQSTLIEGNRANQGTYITGASVVYDRPTTAKGVFEVDGNGNLFVTQLNPHGNPPIPMFYFGGTGSPSLTFYDSSSELRGKNLYTVSAGSNPQLNIQTSALSLASNRGQSVLASTASATLGHNNFVLQRDENLVFYRWTGVGNSYYVTKFQQNAGGGFSICTAPKQNFTGDYSTLGSETFTCNTPVTRTITYGACSIQVDNGLIVGSTGC
jgi:hypothetical protein